MGPWADADREIREVRRQCGSSLRSPDSRRPWGPVGSGAAKERPRPNVVFEYGYFLVFLRRHSGRVILLKKGELEVLSDVSGIVYVDITDGIEASAEKLRMELEDWLYSRHKNDHVAINSFSFHYRVVTNVFVVACLSFFCTPR